MSQIIHVWCSVLTRDMNKKCSTPSSVWWPCWQIIRKWDRARIWKCKSLDLDKTTPQKARSTRTFWFPPGSYAPNQLTFACEGTFWNKCKGWALAGKLVNVTLKCGIQLFHIRGNISGVYIKTALFSQIKKPVLVFLGLIFNQILTYC